LNTRIHIYKIRNWRPPTYTWAPWYNRIQKHRYCQGYKKTSTGYRKVEDCGAWVKKVDPEARYFFFREQSNWHCSPCPLYYKGDTRYTAVDTRTRIHIYSIKNFRGPAFKW